MPLAVANPAARGLAPNIAARPNPCADGSVHEGTDQLGTGYRS